MINIAKYDQPWISIVDNFLTEEECAHFITQSVSQMKKASTIAGMHHARTNSYAWLKHDHSEITQRVGERIAQTVKMPLENAESFQVVYYDEGEQYHYHYDAFDYEAFTEEEKTKHWDRGGQRMLTALCYLNDGYQGGETGFNQFGINVQPKKGRMIVWFNCEPRTNKRAEISQHAGLPVTYGEKYAMNLWFRESKFT